MKPSDEIFLLIKSMSRSEKLFFRKKFLLLLEDADHNYLKLFDEISKQSAEGNEYYEDKIKEVKFSGKFTKNLSFHKNYLYRSILNSLSFFHLDSKDVYSLRNLVTLAEILSDKLLYDQSMKILQKAKKISVEKDLFNIQYDIINTERMIRRYLNTVEEYSLIIKDLFEEQYQIHETGKNLLDYYNLNEKVGIFLRSQGTGRIRDSKKSQEFDKIFKNPLLLDFKNAKTFLARYIFYNLNLQYHLTKENFEEAYINAKSAVELCENNLDKLKGKLDNYIFSLNNLLNCQTRTQRFDEFDVTADKMKNIEYKYSDMITGSNKVFIFYSLSTLLLSKNMMALNCEKLKVMESDIRKELPQFENKINLYQRIILYYFLSASNFIQNEFENCIFWNGKMFNLGKTDLSEDYQCYAKIIQLISYYELGYIDSMEYALKSAYHFISKKKKIFKYENTIQKYLRRTFRIKTEKELIEMFCEMKIELEILLNDSFEKNAFDAFNIIYWLESKIKKTTVVEILKSKKANED